jgi:hypothetical protein
MWNSSINGLDLISTHRGNNFYNWQHCNWITECLKFDAYLYRISLFQILFFFFKNKIAQSSNWSSAKKEQKINNHALKCSNTRFASTSENSKTSFVHIHAFIHFFFRYLSYLSFHANKSARKKLRFRHDSGVSAGIFLLCISTLFFCFVIIYLFFFMNYIITNSEMKKKKNTQTSDEGQMRHKNTFFI